MTHFVKKDWRKKNLGNRGFTLVELMVSLTVFSIVMTISIGTLLVLVDLNAKAQALYSATTNLSFALDSIAREIRTGYRYHCADSSNLTSQTLPNPVTDGSGDCSTEGGDFITFTREEDGVRMGYRLNNNGDGTGTIEQKEGTGAWIPITAEDVVVDSFEIIMRDSDIDDGNQPTVDMMVEGHVDNGLDVETDFFIQTSIVQRRLDIL